MPRSLQSTLATALLGLLLAPASALGHAAFVGADPEPGARVEASPPAIALSFTEPLNAPLSRAQLIAPDGRRVSGVALERTGQRLLLRPKAALARGAYRVLWHTVSTEDGHALEGEFSFGMRAEAAGGEHAVVQSPLARAGWLRIALRVLLYVAVLLFAAAVIVPVLLRRARPSWLAPESLEPAWEPEARAASARAERVIGDVTWLSVGAAVAATLAEAADAAEGLSPEGLADFLFSGDSGVARLALVGALIVAALAARRRRTLAAGAAAVALLALAASGHAASASPRLPSILNDWLHLLAGAVWLGGIALLVVVWWPALRSGSLELRTAVAREVLPVFGRIAAPAFALALMTGLVSLVVQLGHLDALWTTAYGRVLMVKMAVVAAVAAVSFGLALRLRPRLLAGTIGRAERRHWRLLRSEPFVGLGVVGAVAVLVAFPLPPRQLADADEARAERPPCEPCPLPAPQADELSVADQAGSLLVAGWLRRDRDAVTGTVRVLDRRGRPSRAPARLDDAATSPCGTGCLRVRAPATPRAIRVRVRDRGIDYVAALPARWRAGESRRAQRLLRRAEAAMRALRGVREIEEVTSGPGSYARTEYRLRAPDRMALATSGGVRTVVVGERQWFRAPGQRWERRRYGSGIAFTTRRWFRWTPYGRAVRLLERRRDHGRRIAELALADEATPVWFRLLIDERTGRVLRERMTARAHFMRSRYLDFDRPLSVRAPHAR